MHDERDGPFLTWRMEMPADRRDWTRSGLEAMVEGLMRAKVGWPSDGPARAMNFPM